MSWKIFFILLLVTVQTVKAANSWSTRIETFGCKLLSLAKIAGILGICNDDNGDGNNDGNAVEKNCGYLEDGEQYYLTNGDGKYVVHDVSKQLGFIKKVPVKGASKFTAFKKGCNVYGLCANDFCMSRCDDCKGDIENKTTVKFDEKNADEVYSQWTLMSPNNSTTNGTYYLKADKYGYLTQSKTRNGDGQLTLSTDLSNESEFDFVKVK